jgi:RimJ/RimL family protein N-acetyltransferase
VRCYVEPSPAGGYFVRLRGEAAPLSRHDTEEEAEAAAAAYDRGLARDDSGEYVQLSDGSEVLVRPVRPEDKPLFVAGWSTLSDASVHSRFLVARSALSVHELAFFTEIDHVDHEAIGALDPATGNGVGVARYVRDAQRPHIAEVAVIVVDAWHNRGLAGKLLRRLAERATENRIRIFSATLFASNQAMLGLFERLGPVTITRREGSTIELVVELRP